MCVAVYVATAVGRVHQLFPVLLPLKPALLAAVVAVGLYVLQQSGQRRVDRLRSRTTTCLLALLLWAALSVLTALNQGLAFRQLTDLVKIVLMFVVLAGSVRSLRDVERLTLVYFVATVVYAAVVLSRFQLDADSWRLGAITIKNLVFPEWWLLAPLPATFVLLAIEFVFRFDRLLKGARTRRIEATSVS